jgi:hypothetical protein
VISSTKNLKNNLKNLLNWLTHAFNFFQKKKHLYVWCMHNHPIIMHGKYQTKLHKNDHPLFSQISTFGTTYLYTCTHPTHSHKNTYNHSHLYTHIKIMSCTSSFELNMLSCTHTHHTHHIYLHNQFHFCSHTHTHTETLFELKTVDYIEILLKWKNC